jgi:hypothetical protein
MKYDIIGDIHGHADELKALLATMGYRETAEAWRHADRQAVYVGDFIDRGPRQLESVDIVRRMVDAGTAQAVMGNHEFNAIAWFMPDLDQPGEYLRPHQSAKYGDKNLRQHEAFLSEVAGTARHEEIIDWFLTLPLWLELDGIRVVHACWHPRFMKHLAPRLSAGNRLNRELMADACREPADDPEKDTPEPSMFKAVEALTKGIEIPLPGSGSFLDKDGHKRRRVRIRWWDAGATTYRSSAMLNATDCGQLTDDPIPAHAVIGHDGGTPLFFGHYWQTGNPHPLSDKAACVDYSIARGGKLAAYQWDGEPILDRDQFRWIGR